MAVCFQVALSGVKSSGQRNGVYHIHMGETVLGLKLSKSSGICPHPELGDKVT